jgi:hypothetical protein
VHPSDTAYRKVAQSLQGQIMSDEGALPHAARTAPVD